MALLGLSESTGRIALGSLGSSSAAARVRLGIGFDGRGDVVVGKELACPGIADPPTLALAFPCIGLRRRRARPWKIRFEAHADVAGVWPHIESHRHDGIHRLVDMLVLGALVLDVIPRGRRSNLLGAFRIAHALDGRLPARDSAPAARQAHMGALVKQHSARIGVAVGLALPETGACWLRHWYTTGAGDRPPTGHARFTRQTGPPASLQPRPSGAPGASCARRR